MCGDGLRSFMENHMRIKEFRRHLAHRALPVPEPARSPESEVFVAYCQLREHGVTYSRVHLRRLIEQRHFPRPCLLSANRIAWKLSDLAAWKVSRPQPPHQENEVEVA